MTGTEAPRWQVREDPIPLPGVANSRTGLAVEHADCRWSGVHAAIGVWDAGLARIALPE